MSMNLAIDYETADRITLANLYDTYAHIHRDLMLGGLHVEDRIRYEEVLDALDSLITWFDIPSVAEERIRKIKKTVQDEIILEKYEEKLKTMGDSIE